MGEGIISETACARDKSGGPLPLVMGTVSHRTLSETIANQMPATRRSPIRSVIPAKPVPDLPVPLQDGRVLSGSGNPEKPKNFRDAARVQACVASRTWGRSSVTRTPPWQKGGIERAIGRRRRTLPHLHARSRKQARPMSLPCLSGGFISVALRGKDVDSR